MPPVLTRLVRRVVLGAGLALGLGWPALAGPGDGVYHATAHGDLVAGVARDAALPVGHCNQCHAERNRARPAHVYGLFADPDNALCGDCHVDTGAAAVWLGPATYDAGSHWMGGALLWPGPDPAARAAGDEGLCLNCHSPHGERDAGGLVPALAVAREEALCDACHDASGPAATDVAGQLAATDAHPVLAAGVHELGEGLDPAAFGVGSRHAECTDCHNPHAATPADRLAGVSRIAVVNGAANTVPAYVARAGDDPAAVHEYEVCFKCHSSWTTLPAGAHDLALELNPANASFHPVQAAGTNGTNAMTNSLAGGRGAPDLTTGSTITCSDCHGSDAIGSGVTTVSSYVGAEPTGPHGSDAATNANLSGAVLRAAYRTTLKGANQAYAAAEFEECFLCHSPAPFAARNEDARNDTNFRLHGLHMNNLGGSANAICTECHASIHGTAGAPHATNRTYARLVSFRSNVTGRNGVGQPSWSPGSCTLRCHGQNHDAEGY